MAVIKNDEIFFGGASSPIKVGIKLNGKEDVGTEVVANPELTGEEEALTGLEVGGTKYKAGKSLYIHFIYLEGTLLKTETGINFWFISDSADEITNMTALNTAVRKFAPPYNTYYGGFIPATCTQSENFSVTGFKPKGNEADIFTVFFTTDTNKFTGGANTLSNITRVHDTVTEL